MSMDGLIWFSLIVTSYLIGGVPTAFLAARLLIGQDIRQIGDRNPGAANVFRNVSPRAGLIVGAIDVAKGAVAILLVRSLVGSTPLEMLAGVAVLAGHNWPICLGLRGGRGAATAVGVLLAMLPVLAIPVASVSLVMLALTKKTILALGFMLILVPVLAWPVGYTYPVAVYSLAIAVIVGLTHYFSIQGLAAEDNSESEQGDEHVLPRG